MSNITALYLTSLSSGSRPTMTSALNKVATAIGCDSRDSIPWTTLDYETIIHIRQWLSESGNDGRPLSSAAVNKILSAVRGALKTAWKMGAISFETYNLLSSIEPVGRDSDDDPVGRELSEDEIRSMLGVCDESPLGIRDKSIISLMASTGLRRGEVCGLNAEDCNLTAQTIRVLGKGNKRRTVDIMGSAADWMCEWFSIRGDEPGALFNQIRKGGHVQAGTRLTEVGLNGILQGRAELAGITDFTPHDFRRTVISRLLDTTDIVTAQRIAGHSSPVVTSRYDRRPMQRRREALSAIAL